MNLFISKFIDKIKSNSILKSSIGLLSITLCVKVFGYTEKIVLAYYYGTSYQVDVYTLVITIVLSLFFFFREIIEPGYLNTFLNTRTNGNEKNAWNLFNKGIRILFLFTIAITTVTLLFPDKVVNIFAPGFHGEKLDLSVKLIQIAIPSCIFLVLSTLTGITLNGLKIFVLPASGELIFKGSIIICMIIFYKSYGIIGAAIGIVVGSIGRLGVHLIKLFSKLSLHPTNILKENSTRFWILTWPLILGVMFSQISTLIDNVFASYLQEGAISALSYSKKIIDLPVVIFPYLLSIVVFPYFSQLAIEKNMEKLTQIFFESLRWIVIIFLPLSVFFFVFSKPIVEILLQRGAFNASSTLLTSKPLSIYSIGLLFFSVETILVIFYYANGDTKTPVFVGICCTILNILLTYIFIQFIGYIGIALAYVAQKIIKNLILLEILRKRIHVNFIKEFLIKIGLAGSIFVLIIFLIKVFVYNKYNIDGLVKLLFLLISFTAGGLFYLIVLFKIRVPKLSGTFITS